MSNSLYFLGVDVGATKTHALLADETGRALGLGEGGPGNHEVVGYDGLIEVLRNVVTQAAASAGITLAQIAGAGFGVAGYDWPSEKEPTLQAIAMLGLRAPVAAVNDSVLGLLAGSPEGWGLAVVSGTSCNCWGWDRTRQKIGQVTGGSWQLGEGAGGGEVAIRALQSIAHAWTGRGPKTALTQAFMQTLGAQTPEEMFEGIMSNHYSVNAAFAPLVFQVAATGDAVALDVIRWAGAELGELANTVIHQLAFENEAFDVVQIGSMYNGSPLLTEAMRQKIHEVAPRARLVRLTAPPVIGAVILGMEQTNCPPTALVRQNLAATASNHHSTLLTPDLP